MPLRYVESPNLDIQSFLPKTEFLLSGVQQAQQRHDLARQAWATNVQQALDRQYANQTDRDAYIQQQQQLFDNVITKNYGNLSAGAGDVLTAIEIDKANPYHNLNKYQLSQLAIEQDKVNKLQDKAIKLSDVGNQRLYDSNIGWNTDLNRITANVLESPNYEDITEKISASQVNDIVNLTKQQKENWKDRYQGKELDYMISQFSEKMLDEYLDKAGVDALIGATGDIMRVDNSINAAYNSNLGINQFQDINGQIDKNKVREFMKKQLYDKVNVQTKDEPKANVTNFNSYIKLNNGVNTPEASNIAMTSIVGETKYDNNYDKAVTVNIKNKDNNIKNYKTNIDNNIQNLKKLGFNVTNPQDLFKYLTNGKVDFNKIGGSKEVESLIHNIQDNLVSIEEENIEKNKLNNLRSIGLEKSINSLTKKDINLGRFTNLGITDIEDYKNFIKNNLNLTKEEFINTYKNKYTTVTTENVPYYGQITLDPEYQASKAYDEMQESVKKNINNYDSYIVHKNITNPNPNSPEALYSKTMKEAADDYGNNLEYVIKNFKDENGNSLGNFVLNGTNVNSKYRKYFAKNKTITQVLEDGFDDNKSGGVDVKFLTPEAKDETYGTTAHIQLIDKTTNNIIATIPNARHTDKEFSKEVSGRQLSNALLQSVSKPYQIKYLKQSLLNYGAANNSEQIWKAGAKYTPVGETTQTNLIVGNMDVPIYTEAYNVPGVGKRFMIYDNNKNLIKSDIKENDLYNNMFLLSGKYALMYDTNLESLLSVDTKLSNKIEEIQNGNLEIFNSIFK